MQDYHRDDYQSEEEAEYFAAERGYALERTNAPGIMLIVVGVINLLLAAYLLFEGYELKQMPDQDFVNQMKARLKAEQLKQFEASGLALEKLKHFVERGELLCGGIALLLSPLTILAGVRMRSLNSRGLALLGSVAALVPCISLSACLLIGVVAGIWALVVLSNERVRAAFTKDHLEWESS